MNAFIYIVLGLMVACNIGICIWMVIKSHQSDAAYEKALDEIYGRKR
jgi:hypothetical protein